MKYQRGQVVGLVTIGAARDNWRKTVSEAFADLRLNSIAPRPRLQYEEALLRAAISEILSIRLCAAYNPILAGLERIERKIGALADIRREPWAPALHEVNR